MHVDDLLDRECQRAENDVLPLPAVRFAGPRSSESDAGSARADCEKQRECNRAGNPDYGLRNSRRWTEERGKTGPKKTVEACFPVRVPEDAEPQPQPESRAETHHHEHASHPEQRLEGVHREEAVDGQNAWREQHRNARQN